MSSFDMASRSRIPAARGDRARILVVDDEAFMIRSIERALASEFAVSSVTSGHAALALLRQGARFDAILCDLMMPEITGMEVLAELVRTAPDQAKRFAMMTGGAFLPHAQEFLRECNCRVLDKPFSRHELIACVRALAAPST